MTFPSDSTENVAYTYDQTGHGSGIGRLTSVSDAAGTLSRSYDQLGNLLTDARTTGTINLTTTYSYDLANRIASITYPSGTLVSYARDTMGRVTSVTEKPSGGTSATVVSSVGYEPFGPDSGFRTGSAGQETRGFDQDYRLTNVTDLGTVRRGVTRVFENLSYAYYPTNNVETITDGVTPANDQSFSYDSLQRLSQGQGVYGSYAYTYDKDGNRLTETHGSMTTDYGYGSGNDLLATLTVSGITTQTIGYTADGRMATFNPGIESPGSELITSLSYNQDARLAAVNAGTDALASYTYDGFGQRLVKTISSTRGNIYQYGPNGMLLEEANQSGTAQADYIYLNGRPIADLAPSTRTFYSLQDDMLGTPQSASDSTQNIQWQASYAPFGQTSLISGTITQNLRLPGQYFDSESGWNHNGFRNYLPDLGRYAEPDPLAMRGTATYYDPRTGRLLNQEPFLGNAGMNIYVYGANNPTGLIDPLGELTQVAIGGPVGDNIFGHASIIINGQVFSYGTNYTDGGPGLGDWGADAETFLDAQNGFRSTTLLTLDISQDQENALLQYLNQHNPNAAGSPSYSALTNSCVSTTENALIKTKIETLINDGLPSCAGGECMPISAATTPAGLEINLELQPGLVSGTTTVGNQTTGDLGALWGTLWYGVSHVSH
jgi:RHS repeat-associated protein